jgi:hypothetical protein
MKNILFIIGLLIVFSGCNGYKIIAGNEPKSLKDTVRLVERYVKTIKPKPPITKTGKTVYIKDTAALSKLKKKLDSVMALPPKVLTLQDSCGKESIEAYNEGNSIGYSQGYYDAKSECKSTHQTDTLYQDTPETLLQLYNQKLKAETDTKTITALTKEKITLTAQKAAKSNENWFWRAVALLTILYLLFKPKIDTLFKSIISKFKKK